MKGKCDVDFTRHPTDADAVISSKWERGGRRGGRAGGGSGGEVNFGVVDNFPYPPFVTHSTLTSAQVGGKE